MSDTPRTDQQINGKPCTRFEVLAGDSLRNASVPSEFARQLERELNAANDRIKRLEEALEGTVKWIVQLADSGDAGFWHVDDQPEIIAARAALKKEDK